MLKQHRTKTTALLIVGHDEGDLRLGAADRVVRPDPDDAVSYTHLTLPTSDLV